MTIFRLRELQNSHRQFLIWMITSGRLQSGSFKSRWHVWKGLSCGEELMLKLQKNARRKRNWLKLKKDSEPDPVIDICNDTNRALVMMPLRLWYETQTYL